MQRAEGEEVRAYLVRGERARGGGDRRSPCAEGARSRLHTAGSSERVYGTPGASLLPVLAVLGWAGVRPARGLPGGPLARRPRCLRALLAPYRSRPFLLTP